jgi:hypothetical protein
VLGSLGELFGIQTYALRRRSLPRAIAWAYAGTHSCQLLLECESYNQDGNRGSHLTKGGTRHSARQQPGAVVAADLQLDPHAAPAACGGRS